MKQVLNLLNVVALAALGAGAGPALADEPASAEAAVVALPTAEALFGAPLSDEELSGNRGGADTHLSNIRAVGSVSDISASDLVTGHNIITDGALAGASGIPMFIQNSGNGVLIQNAVIVNLDMN